MTLIIMKTHCAKQIPNIVEYCDYKRFLNDLFTKELEQNLRPGLDKTFKCSQSHPTMCKTLKRHAPLKKRFIRVN